MLRLTTRFAALCLATMAVGIAALASGKVRPAGPATVLLTGRNIDMTLHARIVGGETPDLAGGAAHA